MCHSQLVLDMQAAAGNIKAASSREKLMLFWWVHTEFAVALSIAKPKRLRVTTGASWCGQKISCE
jgi:hypothetical protein